MPHGRGESGARSSRPCMFPDRRSSVPGKKILNINPVPESFQQRLFEYRTVAVPLPAAFRSHSKQVWRLASPSLQIDVNERAVCDFVYPHDVSGADHVARFVLDLLVR
ncbi:hypothetical protein BDI4_430121 [Burkholderia diffusa]|nr:hypothetical protein BDI4_430121 [Burkholderia diffusa]